MIPGFLPVPSRADIQVALWTVLLQILPEGVEAIEGQGNNVPEPVGDFVMMTVLRQQRLATNIAKYDDCAFTGSIVGTALSVQTMRFGSLQVGRAILGTGAATAPIITAVITPTSATLSQAMTVAPRPLAAGAKVFSQKTDFVFQLDIHCGDDDRASDMAQTISTVMRDDTGVQLFRAANPLISPLHADDPAQRPFVNAEGQFEDRYSVDCHIQADQVLSPTQEFADEVVIDRVAVDLFYPA